MQRWPFTPAPVRVAWRWARGVRLALSILVLAAALAAGVSWLSNQSWAWTSGGETFSCDQGQSLQWHGIDHGNGYVIQCVTRH